MALGSQGMRLHHGAHNAGTRYISATLQSNQLAEVYGPQNGLYSTGGPGSFGQAYMPPQQPQSIDGCVLQGNSNRGISHANGFSEVAGFNNVNPFATLRLTLGHRTIHTRGPTLGMAYNCSFLLPQAKSSSRTCCPFHLYLIVVFAFVHPYFTPVIRRHLSPSQLLALTPSYHMHLYILSRQLLSYPTTAHLYFAILHPIFTTIFPFYFPAVSYLFHHLFVTRLGCGGEFKLRLNDLSTSLVHHPRNLTRDHHPPSLKVSSRSIRASHASHLSTDSTLEP